MKIFILQRHDTAVLSKDLEWTCDITSNDAKQIDLRVNIIECEADANGRPVMQLEAENVSQIEAIKSQPSAA